MGRSPCWVPLLPPVRLYRSTNSSQDSRRDRSRLQLVSKTAFTPKDLRKPVSFRNAWEGTDKKGQVKKGEIY